MIHICPACGKQWECECAQKVIEQHEDEVGSHDIEIACSEKCAYQLGALVAFLARRFMR